MTREALALLQQVRTLSEEDRAELIDEMIGSLSDSEVWKSDWSAEAHRRWEEHVAEGRKSIPAEQVSSNAREAVKKVREGK